MDLVSFGFLALMVLVGGVVAYFADNLGRTLGKKRLTLFHMRPRHTATLITVIAGMLIPFITVLLVATASSDFRQWVAEGRAAIAERDKVARQRDQYVAEAHEAQDKAEQMLARNTKLARDQERLKKANGRLENANKEAGVLLASTKSQLASRQVQLAKVTAQVRQSAAEIRKLTTDIGSLQSQLVAVRTNKSKLEKVYAEAQKKYDTLQTSFYALKKNNDEAYAKNNELLAQNDNLSSEIGKLGKDKFYLEEQVDNSRRELLKNESDLESVRLALDQARVDLMRMRDYLVNDPSRFEQIIVAKGDELARVSVPAHATPEQAKGLLNNLLKQAKIMAAEKGAKPLVGGGSDAAGLFRRPEGSGKFVEPAEQEEQVIDMLTRSNEDMVLVAAAFSNSFYGEWVPLDIRPYPNPVVFKKGQTIAETRINGGDTDAAIYRQIQDFLRSTVGPKARELKMIPAGKQVGEVPPNDMLDLVSRIKNADRFVRLVARAVADTRAADPLHLRFEVK